MLEKYKAQLMSQSPAIVGSLYEPLSQKEAASLTTHKF